MISSADLPVFLLLWAAALSVITALAHSVLGEQRLIAPLLASDAPLMQNPLARSVTRFAWHWTSILWVLVAITLSLAAYGTIESTYLLVAIGGAHVVMGLADAILTRGKHIGWPLITLIGALTLLAIYQTQ